MLKIRVKIRDFASVIGTVIANFPAVRYGKMRYLDLEQSKCEALRISNGNFDHLMEVSPLAKVELQWWVTRMSNSFNYIHPNCPVVIMNTDAPNNGWGAASAGVSTGGQWNIILMFLNLSLFFWD